MKNLTIIITMAGLGSRFRKAGYNCPKYMIEAKGKTLFEWSMDSLIGYNEFVIKYIFVVRKEDHAEKFIKKTMLKYNIFDIEVISIDYLTEGQAATCILAMPYCEENNPILIYNIDTYIEPYQLNYKDIKGDGYIPCFNAPGDHWSFVRLDEHEKVVEVCEKNRISNNCSLGAYYFSSAKLYKYLYDIYYKNEKNNKQNEEYIAPLYNIMIQKGMCVEIALVDTKKVHVLGTPEELQKFIK